MNISLSFQCIGYAPDCEGWQGQTTQEPGYHVQSVKAWEASTSLVHSCSAANSGQETSLPARCAPQALFVSDYAVSFHKYTEQKQDYSIVLLELLWWQAWLVKAFVLEYFVYMRWCGCSCAEY